MIILLLKSNPRLHCMTKDKVLFSTIIKKNKTKSSNSIHITIPKLAIQAFDSKPHYFELRVFPDRIELRPHEFKFVSGKSKLTNTRKKKNK